VIVMPTEAEAKAFVAYLPPERRAHVTAGTPEQVVDVLGQYIEAGFTGFTFNNAMHRTPEQIATVGELLRLVKPVPAR
jgi:alkanesulfonate monooxygenase SsuD/methylene tetrahydromethanopterin reductase-like flavin-dependent oxidoreductase (luciferase family)